MYAYQITEGNKENMRKHKSNFVSNCNKSHLVEPEADVTAYLMILSHVCVTLHHHMPHPGNIMNRKIKREMVRLFEYSLLYYEHHANTG